MKKILKIVFPILATLIFAGCVKVQNKHLKHRMCKITVGMSKNEVVEILGKDGYVRSSAINELNKVIEILQYEYKFQDYDPFIGPRRFPDEHDTYWFKFYDGKLVNWGKPGDWKKEADNISEIRFR